MKAIRKTVNSNKGFITFWLVLFFFTAGFAKSFVSVFPSNHKSGNTAQTFSSKHVLTTASDSDASLSFIDQLKGGDGDDNDLEFAFFGNYTFPQFYGPVTAEKNFAEFTPQNTIYSVPLYDLYCNWKFHLS